VYACVKVQAASAENTAVILQAAPFAANPGKLYAAGLVNGAFKTTDVPPQELVIVNVPVAGAFVKVTFPDTSYCCVATLQGVGVAEIAEILHVTVHGAVAVKGVVSVQVGSAENVAVTVQAALLAGIPANE
jgi:hypothetical protein